MNLQIIIVPKDPKIPPFFADIEKEKHWLDTEKIEHVTEAVDIGDPTALREMAEWYLGHIDQHQWAAIAGLCKRAANAAEEGSEEPKEEKLGPTKIKALEPPEPKPRPIHVEPFIQHIRAAGWNCPNCKQSHSTTSPDLIKAAEQRRPVNTNCMRCGQAVVVVKG